MSLAPPSAAERGPLRDTDMPGADYLDAATDAALTETQQVAQCAAWCANDARCVAWTFVRAGHNDTLQPRWDFSPRCALKQRVPSRVPGSACCVSGLTSARTFGVRRDAATGTLGATTAQVGPAPLTTFVPGTHGAVAEVTMRVFVDHSIVEAFKDDGLERVSSRVYVPGAGVGGGPSQQAPRNAVTLFAESADGGPPPAGVRAVNVSVWCLRGIWP